VGWAFFEDWPGLSQVVHAGVALSDGTMRDARQIDDPPPLPVEQARPPAAPTPAAGLAPAPRVGPEPLPGPPPKVGSDLVSLHLNGVEVREALEMISRSHGLNILLAPNVAGQVTANFENVPLDTALAGILRLCNLAANQEGNLIFVYPADNAPHQDLLLRVFPLDYASAEALIPTVEGLLSVGGRAFVSAIVATDNRQTREAIVVTDSLAALMRIEEYLTQMDQAPRQVMIEAHVLEVILSDEHRHGVNYRHILNRHLEIDLAGMADPTAAPSLFARIGSSDVDALVECLQTTTDAKTLASPRIMVVNGQKARIQVGEQLGFKVVTVTETAAVEDVKFLEVGVVLEVTPQVTRDNRVLMRVKPEVSSGRVNPDTLLPEEQTRELESDVLLADGQGVVIGGLLQEKDSSTRRKIPFLGDLFLIGKLFQRHELTKERSEIVITLVPRILDCECIRDERDIIDAERSQTPIFEGPLNRLPRPWEPMMPDPIRNPQPLFQSY
jgi:type II secretory pathway component GspD/PulD (secretin)